MTTQYRNEPFAYLMMFVSAVFGLGGVVFAITRTEASFVNRWAPAAVIVALAVFMFLRLGRAGVFANDAGIKVVNPLKTDRVPWEHLVRFTLKAHKGFPAVGFAELIDGRRIMIWGIQARSPSPGARRIPEKLIDELNERLREQRTRAPADPPPPGP